MNVLRALLRTTDPEADTSRLQTMGQIINRSLVGQQFSLALLSGFALCALALAAVGLYGVVSDLVTQRTRDVGIRIALGARKVTVAGWVLRHGLRLTLPGLAFGLGASWAATRLLAGTLFGISPTDPMTFVGVSLLLGAVALAACCLPAWRATRVEPMDALRYE
jgi:ABC-type antimicrobial peptide transport system permease subunit